MDHMLGWLSAPHGGNRQLTNRSEVLDRVLGHLNGRHLLFGRNRGIAKPAFG